MPFPSPELYPSTLLAPGVGDERRLVWGDLGQRIFETGLDRGVLYPKTSGAVPWNGLTAVDENGGDGSIEFYMDGRPFLFIPTPKEFTATIKAVTYPDEFAEVVGITEIADGMYLDSQQGVPFDLSYRTLIGNATEGIKAGYKIHLIYNATVTPQSIGYSTMTDSIDPIEFSWDIQAVPVCVEGYRPTAHVIIDTRHMDSDRLALIESILYGDADTAASMPDPSIIFDILNFGDMIIITDNGDGTWDAEGAYQNVYMIEDGVFEIDNVNATDNPDGTTYDISSTP